MAARRLILWDIDHTLIDTRGIGREIFAESFRQVTGHSMERQARIDGSTDPVIFQETAALHGIDTGRDEFERFAAVLADGHLKRLTELRERGHALPGASAALEAIAALPHITQTVVTGNIQATARFKLEIFGLDARMNWRIGAYGEDDDARPKLVALAIERARQQLDALLLPKDTILIGDTPADVKAGQENDVTVIAVATGRSTQDELRDAGASTVVTDLTDTDALVQLVSAR